MKKYFYLCVIILLFAICIGICAPTVYGLVIEVTEPSGVDTGVDTDLQKVGQKIWSIARAVLQYASIGLFIYAGIRYMIASADQKADIKKSMVPLVIGTLIVFGGTFVIDFVISLFKDVSGMP